MRHGFCHSFWMSFVFLIFCGVGGIVANLAHAQEAIFGDNSIVPGQMGYNALPTIPVTDPVVGEEVLVEITGAAQFGDFSFEDASAVPYFRLVVPFRQLAALEFEGTPVEFWRVSPETRDRIGAVHQSGISKGDIRFGGRFYIFRETEHLPAFGVRFITKTTTGKDLEDRRFTNAPAYVIDALFAKTVFNSDGVIERIRVLAKLGFLAWQQGSNQQNDAPDYGAAIQTTFESGLLMNVEVRGYWGYQNNDKPLLASLGFTYPGERFDWVVTVNKGLTSDAPPWELRAGFIVHFEMPYFKRAKVKK